MRICLFTDTLGDVNGVSRFIRDIAVQALAAGRDLRVFTSTRFEIPRQPNLFNFPPRAAIRMPGYPQLELVLPPVRRMLAAAIAHNPDGIHISTPGPVGLVGRLAARRPPTLGVPITATYHTDFPAYIDRLFDDALLTALTTRAMRRFYRPMGAIFSRSSDYAGRLEKLGIPRERLVRLRPGIDLERFSPRFADEGLWPRLAIPAGPKVLYCGRVSIEKNLPLLVSAWRQLCSSASPAARLIIVGDGPYREPMQQALESLENVHFLGFRHGAELSAIYASSDLLVFPSATDTLGQVVMEGQASGVPVLVSDVGGPQEVVQDGITGCVLPAHDSSAWAAAIAALLTDEPRRRAMSAAAAVAMQSYSIRGSFEHWWGEIAKST